MGPTGALRKLKSFGNRLVDRNRVYRNEKTCSGRKGEDKAVSVMILGPSLDALSGVSTHLRHMLGSCLASEFRMIHFQVGSEGRIEGRFGQLMRLAASPFLLLIKILLMRPDIVHLNSSMLAKSYWRDNAYLIVAYFLRRKIVYQIHGGALPHEFFKHSRLLTFILGRVLKAADALVVLGQHEQRAYTAFNSSLSPIVIPNAVQLDTDASWSDRARFEEPCLHVVYVGRLVASKGVFEIAEALSLMARSGRSYRWLVAGDGPDETALRERVATLGISKEVSFLGAVRGEDKEKVWRTAHVFVFPTYHEGLPYALLESMAAGTPAVVSPVGAIPEVVEDGVDGVYLLDRDPRHIADVLRNLDDNRELLRRMGEASLRKINARYSVDRLTRQFAEVYRNLG